MAARGTDTDLRAVDAYLADVRDRAARTVPVVGVYVGGSYAFGAYVPGRSDLDVAVVSPRALAREEKEALVARVRHEALPCPARGLELVVYGAEAAASPDVAPDFELNLNTGAAMPFRVDLEPDPSEAHWFAIDRAILREHGVPLLGPPARETFGRLARGLLLAVVASSLRWHVDGDARSEDAVLNACRALRFAEEGVWSPKPDAGEWALDRVEERALVATALRALRGGPAPPRAATRAFLGRVVDAVVDAG